jgi:ribosomal protein S18 acetylase RimI-like enzyme
MIRVMRETDTPYLAQLFLKGRRQTFHWVDPSHFRLEDFDEQTRGEQIWVAEQGGTPCGFVSVWGDESFVHHLYVSVDWHGQGLGRALLAQGLAAFQKPASLKVATHNTAALAFYHRLGWQNTEDTGHCEITGPWRRLSLE